MKNVVVGVCLLGMLTLAACGSNATNPAVLEPEAQSDVQHKGQGQVQQHNDGDAKSSQQGIEQINEGQVYEQEFNIPFNYDNNFINSSSKVQITLTSHEIVGERHTEDRLKDDTDYIKVFLQVENVGEQNSSEKVIDFNHFKAYDQNGVEITKLIAFAHFDIRYVEGEFKAADLRPGGKNEGYIYIPIEEGAIPTEIIYYETTTEMLMQYADQFVFKL